MHLAPRCDAHYMGGSDTAATFCYLTAGEADNVAYGKLFIANPDLPRRHLLRNRGGGARISVFVHLFELEVITDGEVHTEYGKTLDDRG